MVTGKLRQIVQALAAAMVAAALCNACGGSPSSPTPPVTQPPVVPPSAPANNLPVIDSIALRGTRPSEPPNFADLGETIAVVAKVRDDETPVEQLSLRMVSGRRHVHRHRGERDVAVRPRRDDAGRCHLYAEGDREVRSSQQSAGLLARRQRNGDALAPRLGQGSLRHGAAVPVRLLRLRVSATRNSSCATSTIRPRSASPVTIRSSTMSSATASTTASCHRSSASRP